MKDYLTLLCHMVQGQVSQLLRLQVQNEESGQEISSECCESLWFWLLFFQRSKGRETGYRDLPLKVDSSRKLMNFLASVAAKPLWYQHLCVYQIKKNIQIVFMVQRLNTVYDKLAEYLVPWHSLSSVSLTHKIQ